MEWIIGSLLLVIVVCLIFLKKEKQEFVWDKNTKKGKKGTIVVSKIQDALEDIYDMDR